MSSKIPSPARSQGFSPRRRTRRTLSVASPRSESGKLSAIVEKFVKDDFVLSPMNRRSVLPDDTAIEAPRRASWWKRLEGSSRDVLEALDTNKMTDDLLVEEYEFEVEKGKQNQSVPESSDNESVASIVVPQRRLFNQKKPALGRFADMGSRKSLGKTNIDDESIEDVPKTLFNKGPRNKPTFPAALLNSTNKTINKTVEPENKQTRPNLFGQAGTKRKNMFTDFVLSDSEEDSEVQHKVFGFKKNNKRISLGTRTRRMPSLTPSMTTEIDIDDWNLLPSSTMIGAQEISKISIENIEQIQDNQDDTLTEENPSLPRNTNRSTRKSVIQDDKNDKTLTNENIEAGSRNDDIATNDKSKRRSKTLDRSKTLLNQSTKRKSSQNKSLTGVSANNEEIIEKVVEQQKDSYQLAINERTLEDKMAELHGESIQKAESQKSVLSNKSGVKQNITAEEVATATNSSAKQQSNTHTIPNKSQIISHANQNEDREDTELEHSNEKHESQKHLKEASIPNQDEEMENVSKKYESEEREPSVEDQVTENASKEFSQEDNREEESDEEKEPCTIDQGDSKEMSTENQDEDMEEMVWNDNDNEKPSDEEAEMIAEIEENGEVDVSVKEKERSESIIQKEAAKKSKNITNLTNKSHKVIEASIDNDQMEEKNEVVDETPNNSSHDTTGRNRKRDTTKIKTPEAVLQNMTNDNESFRPIGRSTTFRKSKSLYETMNRPSLATVQESTLGSEGSRNSSTEGSEWDSHRTTRKTIRQTLGKEYTTRKSLRALVMEQSAKRQTELYNKTHVNKTTNKTIVDDAKNASEINKNKTLIEANNKNTSTMNKTKNKTVTEDVNDKYTSTINKTKNKTVIEDINNKNASTINKSKNKTVLEDIKDQNIRFRRTSNRNMSSNVSPNSEFPIHGTSTHHVPDPLISEQQVSYHKSVHDIREPEIIPQIYREDSINIPDNNDSGPEISMNASYGQGMSADTCDHEASAENENVGMTKQFSTPKGIKEISRRNISKSLRNSEEVLDYEGSEDEKSDQEFESEINQDNIEQEDSIHESVLDDEKEDYFNEMEVEQSDKQSEHSKEESQLELEVESDKEESEQEDEDSQQELDAESDNEEHEPEQSQQEIEIDSDKGNSQGEIEAENEESEQEISQEDVEIDSDKEDSQREFESENEDSQEIAESEQEESQQDDPESEQESDNEQDQDTFQASDPESDPELSREPHTLSKNEDDFVSRLSNQSDKRSRVVFDSQMMSDEEIDFEGVSRQTNDTTEQSEISRSIQQDSSRSIQQSSRSLARVSEPSRHDVSIQTKKSVLLMQMEKIAQQSKERRQKIRDDLLKCLKPSRNITSPVPYYPARRIVKEPRQPKKPKPAAVGKKNLPNAFLEDMKYKPPKRFQPANAPWITKRLYKFLETKLEPKYDYRARVRAEELVQTIHSFSTLVRRRGVAPPQAVDELKREMARLRIVNTHFEFYEFFHDFMPREVRIKVNPDVVNRIAMPRNGIFGEILQPRAAVVE